MIRGLAGVVAGIVAWFVVATAGNLVLRAGWASYAEVEKAMQFTPSMMAARLILGALASLGAGIAVAAITRRNGRAAQALAAVLFAMFIPVHYALWDRFPLWYHATFLASLVVMTLLGSMFVRATPPVAGNPGSG